MGQLTGTLTPTALGTSQGVTGGTVTEQVALPVDLAQSGATCTIVVLDLGPLDLNLLGLHIHLDEVHLVIEAHPGEANLLGNLLCAIAGLLDNSQGALASLAQLLNRLLGALG